MGVSLIVTGCNAAVPVPPSAAPPSTPVATASPAGTSTPPASSQPSRAVRLTGPYLGQTPPGATPQIFAPGVVSNPRSTEWSGTFSPDGTEYYFNRVLGAAPSELLSSRVVDGAWTGPEQVAITAGPSAGEPHVTFDNQRLYFMSDRPVPVGKPSAPAYYVAQRTSGGWSQPTYAGQGMFMSSTRAGRVYTTDMSSSETDDTTYLAQVATDHNGLFTGFTRLTIEPFLGFQAHPCISPDGRYLLFDVDSGGHLFVSFRQTDGTWGQAIDLSAHGFDPLAGGATISPDGKFLFFQLGGDIWWVDAQVIEALGPKA